MNPEQASDYELQISQNRRDITDIDSIMLRSQHAYNFAALESRWAHHMNEQGITDVQARNQFLR